MTERSDQKQHLKDSAQDANKLDLRNEIQAEYGQHPIPWFKWVFNQLELAAGSRVQELGCGSGQMWQENLTRLSPHVRILLSDITFEMVAAARAHLKNYRRFRFLDLDSQNLPFPGDYFDSVLAIGLLDLVPDRRKTLDEIRRVLKPNGQFVTSAGGEGHLHEMEEMLTPYLPPGQAEQMGGSEASFGLDNGKRLLSDYFKNVSRSRYQDQMIFTELQPILDYIFSEQAVAWSMNLEQLADFTHHLKNRLAENGEITVTIHKGLLMGRKEHP